jgi:hypothetical protein
MRHELTADTLAKLILWGLDQARAGRPRPLHWRWAPTPDAPLVALVDYVSGFPCLWVTPGAFYGEPTATLLEDVWEAQAGHAHCPLFPHILYRRWIAACKVGNSIGSSVACCTPWSRAAAWYSIGW